MSIEIKIPDIGDEALAVIEILVSIGDSVSKEDPLMILESDKAAVEVPAPSDGIIESLTISLNDQLSSGMVVGSMSGESVKSVETTVKDNEPAKEVEAIPSKTTTSTKAVKKEPEQVVVKSETIKKPVDELAFNNSHASPSVRKFARDLGADLGKISGTGRKNRVTNEDVSAYVKSILSGGASVAGISSGQNTGSGIPAVPSIDFSKFGSVEEQKLSRINVLTGEHMTRCWLNIPHVTQNDEADITDLEIFRKSLRAETEKIGIRVSMLAFLMKAVVSGMKAYPNFNSSLSTDGQSLIMKGYFNIGIAVDTPTGLVVPVIKDVDQKSIYDLSRDLMELSKKARDGKLKPSDMQGGCMTISSLGGIGGTSFTPIVNSPEVAILGVSRSKMQPVWNGSEFVPKNILPMSLSYDHRVIDGADGARFTQHLSVILSDARRLLL